ncbi:MAG: GNAT family N-acetyltransferase [Candidatus Poribacteria bacterium]|nr:GNAT family N-acetyltransferase [Candidatus Poribacteria bacterium]
MSDGLRIVREMHGDRVCYIQLVSGEQKVSWLWLIEYRMRVGGAMVSMGGIAGVGTDEKHRKLGYATRVLNDSLDYMREKGFHTAGLFGIRDFYERWDYSQGIPNYSLTVQTASLDRVEATPTVRPFEKSDGSRIAKMFNANNEGRTCCIYRNEKTWDEFEHATMWGIEAEAWVVLDQGEIVGYAVVDRKDDRTKVAEVGYRSRRDMPAVAASLRDRARKHGHDSIRFIIPPDHPFTIYLNRFGCVAETEFVRTGDGMFRIIHLLPTFEAIMGDLERRLSLSPLRAWSGTFDVTTDLGVVRVTGIKGALTVASADKPKSPTLAITQNRLTQLMLGYYDIDDLTTFDNVDAPDILLPILRVLFPRGLPFMWWSDRF